MTPVLDVEGLSVEIPSPAGPLRAVDDLSFAIPAGRTLCIVGESGSGKSMTALALMDLLPNRARREARRLRICGEDLLHRDETAMSALRGRRMAMIFQEPMTSLNPVWTIGEQLTEGFLRHRLGSPRAARDRAVALLERVGITGAPARLAQYPHQLSGGLRQRVMIAMALMGGPELLIADEPTTALDVTIQLQILRLLRELQTEFGLALLFITHDLGLVSRLADEVLVMYAGQAVERASCAALFASPAHPYTRGLLDALPVPGRVARGTALRAIPGLVETPIGAPKACRFAGRCGFVTEACRSKAVPETRLAEDRHVRCLRPLSAGWSA